MKTHYYAGGAVRICECSMHPLRIYTDGVKKYANCQECKKTWELPEPVLIKNKAKKALDSQSGLGVSSSHED